MYNSNHILCLFKAIAFILITFIVINTVKPKSILELVKKAEKTRKELFEKEDEGEFIEIHNDIYKLLKLTPVYNSIILFNSLIIIISLQNLKGKCTK